MSNPEDDARKIAHELAEPFALDEIKFKPQAVSGSRALAIGYINARCVMDRLDAVVGVENWKDAYTVLPDGNVICRLFLRINGEWVEKTDVGGESEQPDGGDRMKAAFSDALKRAAIKFGVARYLYRLPHLWVDYDAQKKQFVKTPTLPAWALPGGGKATAPPAKPSNGSQKKLAAKPAPLPANGSELANRIAAKDDELAKAGRIEPGALMGAVNDWGDQQTPKLPINVESWQPAVYPALMAFVVQFCKDHPAPVKTPA